MIINHLSLLENEETLDPKDWDSMRVLGHLMIDDMMDYLQNISKNPVWKAPDDASKKALKQPIPLNESDINSVYQDFKEHILPFNKGNVHPRFWAWVQGTGTPLAMLAELLAAAMNPNVAIGDHAAMYVDEQVINWCKTMLNYPSEASGILLSGGSIANITGIIVARNAIEESNIRQGGLFQHKKQLSIYCSVETHSCVQKAAEVIGIGAEGVRKVNVNENYEMDINHLQSLINSDRNNGMQPFCIVGNAGTVGTGAIDPLIEIAAICAKEKLWFHIDGAFGALAKLVPEYQEKLKGIELADSVAFDLHKWMYMPYEIGCVLIKDIKQHRAAFALQPNYLLTHERGLAAGPDPITNYGMELSRGFKSLKFWMSIKEHGINKFARLIRQNIAQVLYLGDLINAESELELLAPISMNIACFRYNPQSIDDTTLNELNKNILMKLHEGGLAAPSYTILQGKYAIRVANVNHRSTKKDFEALVQDVLRLGRSMI